MLTNLAKVQYWVVVGLSSILLFCEIGNLLMVPIVEVGIFTIHLFDVHASLASPSSFSLVCLKAWPSYNRGWPLFHFSLWCACQPGQGTYSIGWPLLYPIWYLSLATFLRYSGGWPFYYSSLWRACQPANHMKDWPLLRPSL